MLLQDHDFALVSVPALQQVLFFLRDHAFIMLKHQSCPALVLSSGQSGWHMVAATNHDLVQLDAGVSSG